ncbi:S-adenosyl methyltransferase [Streptomyces aidingensis]|uniref:S-adenosyl methyltransferase n=2 Tax=Streptomyces aidingensis TaxID=910347 RepID=A0A1I1KNM5_9ACTN|nr:S-adenosyl methyltransferase [Streptomyces aidingensis]
MGVSSAAFRSLLSRAADSLGCRSHAGHLVHTAHLHGLLPLQGIPPSPVSLDPDEWRALRAHSRGVPLSRTLWPQSMSGRRLSDLNQRLLGTLRARTVAQAVHRAWTNGLHRLPADAAREELDGPGLARIFDALLGGREHSRLDRQAARALLNAAPFMETAALIDRAFTEEAVRHLAQHHGIRQFMDIGCGLSAPSGTNVHDIARAVCPDARVVYVDNSYHVVATGRALLRCAPPGKTAICHADLSDPGGILTAAEVIGTLDLRSPIGLLLNGVLEFLPDTAHGPAHGLAEALKSALPSGSALAVRHITSDFQPVALSSALRVLARAGIPAQWRSRGEVEDFFRGWNLLAPGVVPAHRWQPHVIAAELPGAAVMSWAGIAIKP